MNSYPWYITALGAALVWGVHYPLIDMALKRISLVSVLALTCVPIFLLLPVYQQTLRADWQTLWRLSHGERWPVLLLPLSSLVATLLLFLSIDRKNATFASLIEISYPLFVAVFAYMLFGERALNWSMLVGGLLIFAGVAMIVHFNP